MILRHLGTLKESLHTWVSIIWSAKCYHELSISRWTHRDSGYSMLFNMWHSEGKLKIDLGRCKKIRPMSSVLAPGDPQKGQCDIGTHIFLFLLHYLCQTSMKRCSSAEFSFLYGQWTIRVDLIPIPYLKCKITSLWSDLMQRNLITWIRIWQTSGTGISIRKEKEIL